jgi:hypothetical protein
MCPACLLAVSLRLSVRDRQTHWAEQDQLHPNADRAARFRNVGQHAVQSPRRIVLCRFDHAFPTAESCCGVWGSQKSPHPGCQCASFADWKAQGQDTGSTCNAVAPNGQTTVSWWIGPDRIKTQTCIVAPASQSAGLSLRFTHHATLASRHFRLSCAQIHSASP